MITIDPHRFTQHDATRTIENVEPLWPQFALGRPGADALLDPLYPSLTGDIERDLPAAWSALLAAGPALRAAGLLPHRAQGRVDSLQLGTGGVPKLPVDSVEVDWYGVVGDRQAVRRHHGRPWQALCLWSTEVIGSFAGAGHPIAAGSAGENVTLGGLDWADVRPGVRLQLGTVVCDIIAFALPCRSNARWFIGRDFGLMHHDRGPVSRVYAVVVQPGRVHAGDVAILEP
jgi:MOSC domain-containing protein YiiM